VNLEILPVEEEVFEALQVVQVPNPKVVKVNQVVQVPNPKVVKANQVKVNQVKASPVAQVPNPKAVKACLVKASLVKAGLVKAIAVANHPVKVRVDTISMVKTYSISNICMERQDFIFAFDYFPKTYARV